MFVNQYLFCGHYRLSPSIWDAIISYRFIRMSTEFIQSFWKHGRIGYLHMFSWIKKNMVKTTYFHYHFTMVWCRFDTLSTEHAIVVFIFLNRRSWPVLSCFGKMACVWKHTAFKICRVPCVLQELNRDRHLNNSDGYFYFS
jgi:hypothetical protein